MADGLSERAAPAAALDLSHLALSVAKYFVSLDLAHDAGQLTRLGQGRLRLDLLRRTATHELHFVPFPRMGDTLRHRIDTAFQFAEHSRAVLLRAELEAECRYRSIPQPDMVGPRMGGWCGVTGPLIQAEMAITVRLGTAEQQWQTQHKGNTTWPESWGTRR